MKTFGKILKENFLSLGPRMRSSLLATPAHVKHCFSKQTLQRYFSVRGIVFLGLLIAMSIVLRLYTSINIGLTARIELGFLPIAVAGVFFGPIGAAIAYTVADIIGTILAGMTIFIPITLCKFLFGFLLGLFFYEKRLTPACVFLCSLAILFLVDLFAMTSSLSLLYGDKGVKVILIERIYNAAITFPLRFFVILLTDYALHLRNIWHHSGKNT